MFNWFVLAYSLSKHSLTDERERWHYQESILDSECDSSKVKRSDFGKYTKHYEIAEILSRMSYF